MGQVSEARLLPILAFPLTSPSDRAARVVKWIGTYMFDSDWRDHRAISEIVYNTKPLALQKESPLPLVALRLRRNFEPNRHSPHPLFDMPAPSLRTMTGSHTVTTAAMKSHSDIPDSYVALKRDNRQLKAQLARYVIVQLSLRQTKLIGGSIHYVDFMNF